MAFSFKIDKPNDWTTIFPFLKREIERSGGTSSGNSQSGSFSGQGVKANYIVDGSKIRINVISKPFIVSDSFVESKITEMFYSAIRKYAA